MVLVFYAELLGHLAISPLAMSAPILRESSSSDTRTSWYQRTRHHRLVHRTPWCFLWSPRFLFLNVLSVPFVRLGTIDRPRPILGGRRRGM